MAAALMYVTPDNGETWVPWNGGGGGGGGDVFAPHGYFSSDTMPGVVITNTAGPTNSVMEFATGTASVFVGQQGVGKFAINNAVDLFDSPYVVFGPTLTQFNMPVDMPSLNVVGALTVGSFAVGGVLTAGGFNTAGAVNAATGVFSGAVSAASYGAVNGTTGTFSGAVSAASYGAVNATTGTFSGAVSASSYGAMVGTTLNLSGTLTAPGACNLGAVTATSYGAINATTGTFSGAVSASSYGAVNGSTGTFSGTVSAASYGAVNATTGTFSGAVTALTLASTGAVTVGAALTATTSSVFRSKLAVGLSAGLAPANTTLMVDRSGASLLPALPSGNVATFAGSAAAGSTAHVTLIAGNAGASSVFFGDTDSSDTAGIITYRHVGLAMEFYIEGALTFTLNGGINLLAGAFQPTGSILAPDQGAAVPAYTFASDQNTGFYHTVNADEIGVSTAGVERWRWDATGRYVFGGVAAQTTRLGATAVIPQTQLNSQSFAGSAYGAFTYAAASSGGQILLGRSRGATTGAQTIVQNGDSLGRISAAGSDGVQFTEAARINFAVDGAPGVDDMPGRIEFLTSADGTNTPAIALTLKADNSALFTGVGRFNSATQGILSAQKGAGSGATVSVNGDVIVADLNTSGGISILTPAANTGFLLFGSTVSAAQGQIRYTHSTDVLGFYASAGNVANMSASAFSLASGVDAILNSTTPPSSIVSMGFRGSPIVTIAGANYVMVASDCGKALYHTEATARQVAILAGATVPIGSEIRIFNDIGAGVLTINGGDTFWLVGGTAATTRTLAANGDALFVKVAAARWVCRGTGLT